MMAFSKKIEEKPKSSFKNQGNQSRDRKKERKAMAPRKYIEEDSGPEKEAEPVYSLDAVGDARGEEYWYGERRCVRCHDFYTHAGQAGVQLKENEFLCRYHPGKKIFFENQVEHSCCNREPEDAGILVAPLRRFTNTKGCCYKKYHLEDKQYSKNISKFSQGKAFSITNVQEAEVKLNETAEQLQPDIYGFVDLQNASTAAEEATALSNHEEEASPIDLADTGTGDEDDRFFVIDIKTTDTLAGISLRYGVPKDTIKKINKMTMEEVCTRKFLYIPKNEENWNVMPSVNEEAAEARRCARLINFFMNSQKIPKEEARFYLEDNEWDVGKANAALLNDYKWEKSGASNCSEIGAIDPAENEAITSNMNRANQPPLNLKTNNSCSVKKEPSRVFTKKTAVSVPNIDYVQLNSPQQLQRTNQIKNATTTDSGEKNPMLNAASQKASLPVYEENLFYKTCKCPGSNKHQILLPKRLPKRKPQEGTICPPFEPFHRSNARMWTQVCEHIVCAADKSGQFYNAELVGQLIVEPRFDAEMIIELGKTIWDTFPQAMLINTPHSFQTRGSVSPVQGPELYLDPSISIPCLRENRILRLVATTCGPFIAMSYRVPVLSTPFVFLSIKSQISGTSSGNIKGKIDVNVPKFANGSTAEPLTLCCHFGESIIHEQSKVKATKGSIIMHSNNIGWIPSVWSGLQSLLATNGSFSLNLKSVQLKNPSSSVFVSVYGKLDVYQKPLLSIKKSPYWVFVLPTTVSFYASQC